jgi:hypothetical protein
VQATVRVPGFREQRVEGIDGDRTIRLEPQLEVLAQLAPQLDLPSGVTLHAFVRPRGEPDAFRRMLQGQRGPIVGSGDPPKAQTDQRFTFAVGKTGEFQLTFVLALRERDRSIALPATPAVFTVDGASHRQEVAFAAAEADLQAALRELMRD